MTTTRRLTDMPLFLDEVDIARLVLGPGRVSEWKAIAQSLEFQGLPAHRSDIRWPQLARRQSLVRSPGGDRHRDRPGSTGWKGRLGCDPERPKAHAASTALSGATGG